MIVPTPCIGVCKFHPIRKQCMGCYRNAPEIRKWPKLTDEEKLEVLEACDIRKEMYYADT